MKRYWQNDKGYSLLLAIFALLIFSILGLSLMTLTTSGVAKNTSREEVIQATDLAEKGTDYMINNIQAELKNFIANGNIKKDQFLTKLINTIESADLSCENGGIKIPGHLGRTSVCIDIDNIENVYIEKEDGTKILQQLKKKVPIISTGYVNGKEKVTTTEVIIGTDAIPDQLKYAVSTNDEGNLYLHGGVEVQGAIKTDGHLILSESAHWLSGNSARWEDSSYARLIPDSNGVIPKIIMRESGKNIYIAKKPSSLDYNSHISGTSSYLENSNRYTKYLPTNMNTNSLLENQLFLTKKLSLETKNLPGDNVEVEERVTSLYTTKEYDEVYPSELNVRNSSHPTSTYDRNKVIFIHGEKQECKTWFFGCREYYPEKTLSKADFNIYGNDQEINLKGSYFVNGDFNVTNTNLKSDAILYVNGNVTITHSTLSGIDPSSTIIIFASGDIKISNISVDHDTPSTIKGFFYSKQNMIMYGVGSNINLYGGISAKRTILTAVRGTADNDEYESGEVQRTIRNINGVETPLKSSRLKIIYDQNLVSQYSSFEDAVLQEYITQLNDPEIIERY